MCKSLGYEVPTTSEFLIQYSIFFPIPIIELWKGEKWIHFSYLFFFLHPMRGIQSISLRREKYEERDVRVGQIEWTKNHPPTAGRRTHPTSTPETYIRWDVPPTPTTTDLYLLSEYNVDQSRFVTINPSDKQAPRFFRLRFSAGVEYALVEKNPSTYRTLLTLW